MRGSATDTRITPYLTNGSKLEVALKFAKSKSVRTTGLYDRHSYAVPLKEAERILTLETCMEEFTKILRAATAAIEQKYFLLPIHGLDPIYRERVYCYELYHQMRRLWPESRYTLNGEVDKRSHPYFAEGGAPKPDFIVHVPGDGDNYAVMEVKPSHATNDGIQKDLATLARFRQNFGYQRAIYLVYGTDALTTMERVLRYGQEFDVPIEFWLHPEVWVPAFQVPIGEGTST